MEQVKIYRFRISVIEVPRITDSILEDFLGNFLLIRVKCLMLTLCACHILMHVLKFEKYNILVNENKTSFQLKTE